jgi:hypothetical protein
MTGRKPRDPQQPAELKGFDAFDLRLGDVMRGERATLGKSLIDVQRELKIKATYVAAIENADPAAFDTPGFIAGYVRSYARYLGLDPEWAWERFCAEAGFEQPHGLSAAARSPKPPRKTGLEALGDPNASFVPRTESVLDQIELRAVGSLAVLVALIGALGYGAWAVVQEVQRVDLAPVDRAPGVVAELDPLPAGGAAPVVPEAGLSGPATGLAAAPVDAFDRLYRPPALDVPVLVARDGPIAAVEPGSVGVLAEARPSAALPSDRIAGADPAAGPEAGPAPQVVAATAPGVELLAVRPAWGRVSAADGTVLLEKILEPGERWAVPAMEEPPVLRAGNSGAVYFAVNGQTYGPAAPGAQVVRDVALAPEALTGAYALADAAADPDLAAAAVADAAEAAAQAVTEALSE